MALFENVHVKRGLVMACAGALALVFGAVAAPDEAAAQCTIVSSDGVATTPLDEADEIQDPIANAGVAAGDSVSVDCTDSITSGDIDDGTITGTDIDTETITGANVDDETLTGDDIQDGSIGADDLAANSVTDSELADDAVDTAAIQDDAVTWGKLSSGVRNRIDENTEGVAIALALQNPDLVGNESFGLSVNWGGFDNANALGVAATGVLGRDVFGAGDRLSIAGGVGIGMDDDTVGGRVGAQLSW